MLWFLVEEQVTFDFRISLLLMDYYLVNSVLSFQTLTPYMQSTAAKVSDGCRSSNSRKTYGRRQSLGDLEQGNFSVELWKKAFRDACERLCPTRAGGHECGCLPVLSRLVCLRLSTSLM